MLRQKQTVIYSAFDLFKLFIHNLAGYYTKKEIFLRDVKSIKKTLDIFYDKDPQLTPNRDPAKRFL